MINMFTYPVFCVKNGIITEANHHTKHLLISINTPISEFLGDSINEYLNFQGSCISMTLYIAGTAIPAVAIRLHDTDVFHLYAERSADRVQAMTLVAQQVAEPLTELMNIEYLHNAKAYHPSFKKSLYKLQRIVTNISTMNAYTCGRPYGMEVCDIVARVREILEKVQSLAKISRRNLQYTCPKQTILCPVDLVILDKGIFNLISNAIQWSPEDSTIYVTVERCDTRLRISIQNTDDSQSEGYDLFSRYMRAPQIEDGRHGIGLGIPIAHLAACTHNGTLLMDRPETNTIRFTLTISTRIQTGDVVRSPVTQIDHLGGFPRSYIELADVLPTSSFKDI